MIRFALLIVLSVFSFSLLFAQIQNPVKWSFSSKKISDSESEIILKAKIEKKWHLYSLNAGEGPVSTSFTFEKNKNYELVGKVAEGKPVEHFDENFSATVRYFELQAAFKQKVKVKSDKKVKVKGSLEFMVCDDHQCLPPETIEFEVEVDGAAQAAPDQGSINKIEQVDSAKEVKAEADSAQKEIKALVKPTIASVKKAESKSFWGIFIAGFIGGLLALLTPCVFPMIPMTVSFFTKRSKTRAKGIANAFIYGASIIIIYVGLGFIITKSLGPDALNAMASNAFFNLAFFFIFIIFAVSFLGAFEITLPSSWINKADSASDRGGLIGIFFMAFTLSLVSFSCTGPIIGTLLVEAAVGGSNTGPLLGMTGFSLALALPFGLFSAFPGWLHSLPKSGGWLNSVKVVLGLLELALALKFFSNVDLAYGWGILKRELFIALWIVIFSTLGFYLLGKIRFSHDSKTEFVSIPGFLMAVITFAFVIYLIPGMFGAPLKLISGFPPPTFYTEGWKLGGGESSSDKAVMIEGTDPEHCPHNLSCFHDYDKALAYAKQVKKPLFVDFTGWSCVNCRKMEDKVWVDPRVLKYLREDYVVVSLYVDDKTNLPEAERKISETTGKKIKTVGNKWSDMQTKRYLTNSQPYYVLLDANEQLLAQPEAYNPDIENYISFLNKGVEEYKKR